MRGFLTEASSTYDLNVMRINAVVEAANRQREINFHEAELKVMQESGTDDELAMLIEAAESDFVENIRKALDKLRQAIVEFFSKCRQKLVELMSKRDDQNALDKIKKRLKLLPIIGKKKVMIEDYEEEQDIYEKGMKGMNNLAAKLDGGQEVTPDDVSAVINDFDEAWDHAIGAANAKTVTVADAINEAQKLISKGSSDLKAREDDALKAIDRAKKEAENTNANVANQIANGICHFTKTAQTGFHRCVNGIMATIKRSIAGFKKEAPANDASKAEGKSVDMSAASADTSSSKADDTATESTGCGDSDMEKLANQEAYTNSKNSVDEETDDEIDFGFDIAGDDALTDGFGIDDVDSDDDTLDDLSIDVDDDDDEDDEDEDDEDESCCRESSDDAYLASLAGVTIESTHEHEAGYSSLLDEIMSL